MEKSKASCSLELTGDRPPTPPDLPRTKNNHPHPLEANLPLEATRTANGNADSRRMPSNPPSSPVITSTACVPTRSPEPTHARPTSPLSSPATPPPLDDTTRTNGSFKFSRRLMKSKKLSASVHGTLTQPIIYNLSDDD